MTYLPAAAHRHFAAQHGVASLEQLELAGLTRRQIEHLRSTGSLDQTIRGAYRTPSAPITELSRCAEICLAHPDAVIGGPTAGRLHGFRGVTADRRIHITAPRHAHPITATHGVVTFHTDALRSVDVVRRPDGIRVMDRARTVMDLARSRSGIDLRSVTEQAMCDGALSEADMLAVAADFVRRRPWVRKFMMTVGSRVGGGPAESHAEVRVGEALVARHVDGLVRQHRIRVGDRTIRFDLAVPPLRWAIEVDVFPTHQETSGRQSDRRRDASARQLGWTVSRLSRSEYHDGFEAAMDRIAEQYRTMTRRVAS